jgi:tetratricopeptide (TPR) repeat protein
VRGHRSAFVGRRGELALLRRHWQLAKGGERQLVVVLGEPGVGKSRLAAELARAAHAQGAAVLLGRCTEEPLLPYQAFAEALRAHVPPPAEPAGELARLVPGLADLAGAGPAATESDGARFWLFEAVADLLAALSEERPLLLVLEDLHWADKPTLLLLLHLLRAPEPLRLLVVGTYRETELGWSDPLAGALAELRRERTGTRLRLEGLDEGQTTAVVSAWVGNEAPAALAAEVHRRTEGNPFFVEEVLSDLTESGAELAEVGVPEGVKEVVGQRLGRLGEQTRRTLVAASVLGPRFDLHVLAAVLEELSADQLADALDEAASAGVVREEAERAGRFAFSHALVRETLYGQLAGARRTALHGRAAEALERLYGERPERVGEIAHHLFEAAAPPFAERAIDYAVRAADLASAQLAYEDAALQLERALRALELLERADDARRCELLLSLGDARLRAGERADGRAAFAGAARAARALGRADLLARAALGFGGLGVTILEVDEATVALLEEALAALGDEDGPLRARLLGRLAVELYYGPSRERSEALGAGALAVARRSGDRRALAYALNARHVSLWRPDGLDERLGIAREMVALAERAGDPEGALQGRNWLVTDLFEAGEMAQLDEAIDAYEDLAKRFRLRAYEWYAPLWRGGLASLRGEFADAEPMLREAVRIGTLAGDRNVELADQVRLGIVAMRADFEAMYRSFVPIAQPKIGSSPASLSFRCGMAFVAAGSGREAEARDHLEHIAAHGLDRMPFDVNWLETVGTLGEACAMLGDADRAAQLYRLLLPYEGRLEAVAGRALASWGAVDRHLGVMAAAMSRWDDAERHFQAALRVNERLGFRPWLAWTRHQYAQMLGAADAPRNRERAGELLSGAADLASELGLDGLRGRIAGLGESLPGPAAR